MLFVLVSTLTLTGIGIHLFVRRRELSRLLVVETVLLYLLVIQVGFSGITAFIGHVFFGDTIAAKIGWPPGSPFQFEVGISDGAWGVLGVLCIWCRDRFWLATGLGWSLFLLGAGWGHLRDVMQQGNLAPYNAGMILPNFLTPLLILVFLYLYWSLNRRASRDN